MKPQFPRAPASCIRWFAFKASLYPLLLCLSTVATSAIAEDRPARYEELERAYKEADDLFNAEYPGTKGTPEEAIERYKVWPGWKFLPRFVDLAEARPEDEISWRACRWIIDRSYNVGVADKQLYHADAKAWNILGKHQAKHMDFAAICLQAGAYSSPAREHFLRTILQQNDLPHPTVACATLALAEQLASRHETITVRAAAPKVDDSFLKFIYANQAREWEASIAVEHAPQVKTESADLFRRVIKDFGSLRVPTERGIKRLALGQKLD